MLFVSLESIHISQVIIRLPMVDRLGMMDGKDREIGWVSITNMSRAQSIRRSLSSNAETCPKFSMAPIHVSISKALKAA